MDNQMLKKKLDIKFCLLEHRTAGQRFLWARQGHQRSHMFPIGQSDESRGGRMAEKEKYYVRIELVTFRTKDSTSHRATMTNR